MLRHHTLFITTPYLSNKKAVTSCYPRWRRRVRETEGNPFWYVCLSRRVTERTVAAIDLIVLHKAYYTLGAVLLKDDSIPDSRIYWKIRYHRTIYAIKEGHNVKHALWRHMCVIASEGLSSLMALLQEVLWHHMCVIASEGLSSLMALLQEVLWRHMCAIASEGLSSLIALLQEVLWRHMCAIASEGLSSLIVLLQEVLWRHMCVIASEGLSSLMALLQEVLWRHMCVIASEGLSSLMALFSYEIIPQHYPLLWNHPLCSQRLSATEGWHLGYCAQDGKPGPSARHGHSAVVYGGAMWVFGGMMNLETRNDLWCWNFGELDLISKVVFKHWVSGQMLAYFSKRTWLFSRLIIYHFRFNQQRMFPNIFQILYYFSWFQIWISSNILGFF